MSLERIAHRGLRRLGLSRIASPAATPVLALQIGEDMVRRAQAAWAERRPMEAAMLHAEALRLIPPTSDLHMQCGHMYKEAGDLAVAESHYKAAEAMAPQDAEVALQLGHFYKCAGRLTSARNAYLDASKLRPDWDAPERELKALEAAGWCAPGGAVAGNVDPAQLGAMEAAACSTMARAPQLAPDLASRPLPETFVAHQQGIEIRRLGRLEQTHWGERLTLRGVEAIRGFCISAAPILTLELLLNGQMIYRDGVGRGFELAHEGWNKDLRKYVFNIWIDLSDFIEGRYELEYRGVDAKFHVFSRIEQIVIAAPLKPSSLPDSDGVVDAVDPTDPRALTDIINSRPSIVRPGARALLKTPAATVLVQRADQLGDLAVSGPALRRLRQILPQARLVGLIAKANEAFAQTLGLFDELVTIDFPDDPWERRRVMPLDAQAALAARLASFDFDIAIDMSEAPSSRPLLSLSGAPLLVGFPSGDMPGLAVEATGSTHDRWNGFEIVPHTNKLLGLVEWLGAMLWSKTDVVRREDLGRERLTAFGLSRDDKFAVLHDGARLAFSRWPHYLKLASLLLERTDLHVVMLTDDPATAKRLPEDLAQSSRFQIIDRKLEFDDFDALLSFCVVFTGNDSGPKHLAALRGAKVVSLHTARNNWNEWGQTSGYIISRKLPCAGCMIHHDPEECGKDYICIRGIKPQEVCSAVEALLRQDDGSSSPVN